MTKTKIKNGDLIAFPETPTKPIWKVEDMDKKGSFKLRILDRDNWEDEYAHGRYTKSGVSKFGVLIKPKKITNWKRELTK